MHQENSTRKLRNLNLIDLLETATAIEVHLQPS